MLVMIGVRADGGKELVALIDPSPAIRQVGKGAGASRREALTTVHGVVRRHWSLLLTMDLIVGDPGAREVTGTIVRRTSGADTRVLSRAQLCDRVTRYSCGSDDAAR